MTVTQCSVCVKTTTIPSSQLYISEKINRVNLLLIKPGNQPKNMLLCIGLNFDDQYIAAYPAEDRQCQLNVAQSYAIPL
jgi:hypothetical protein